MTQNQAAQVPSHHAPAKPYDQGVPRETNTENRCMSICPASNVGPSSCDMAKRLGFELWTLLQQLNTSSRTLEQYHDIVKKESMERSFVFQQQHDELNARWSRQYAAGLQEAAQKSDIDLKKTRKELEDVRAKLKEQRALNDAAEMASRELRATVELQNREILRSRALHFDLETRERELAESKTVTQATEAVLVLKKQRVSDLEAELKAVRTEMAAKEDRFAADKAEHESLRLQFRTLEAEHADAVDIANGLFEGEAGNTPAEIIGQNKALAQQLWEVRAENEALVAQLKAGGIGSEGLAQDVPIGLKRKQGPDKTSHTVAESAGDESRAGKRRRAKAVPA